MSPVLIVGAGMAGLACALRLTRAGVPCTLLEASDAVGGRLRTDLTPEGFRLDRGFQVLLSSYPELRREDCLKHLDVHPFRSGAVIRQSDGSETCLADPFSEPLRMPRTLLSSVGTLGDKLRVALLFFQSLCRAELTSANSFSKRISTFEFLKSRGWSSRMIQNFFVPFFGGVFLDRSLQTDAGFFLFVFRHFALGRALLPNEGIQALPEHLARQLPPDTLRLNTRVRSVEGTNLTLDTGERMRGSRLVFAVDEHSLTRLLPLRSAPQNWKSTRCTYFSAPVSPAARDGYLRLNAVPNSLVHNVCVPSDVAPGYAPAGRSLVSVSTHGFHSLDPHTFLNALLTELRAWFGAQVDSWTHLRSYSIPHALPAVPDANQPENPQPGIWLCGDHMLSPSLNHAMASGRTVGEAILADIRQN